MIPNTAMPDRRTRRQGLRIRHFSDPHVRRPNMLSTHLAAGFVNHSDRTPDPKKARGKVSGGFFTSSLLRATIQYRESKAYLRPEINRPKIPSRQDISASKWSPVHAHCHKIRAHANQHHQWKISRHSTRVCSHFPIFKTNDVNATNRHCPKSKRKRIMQKRTVLRQMRRLRCQPM